MQRVTTSILLVLLLKCGAAEPLRLTDVEMQRLSEYRSHQEDVGFWREIFANGTTSITEQAFAGHLSVDGRQELGHHITYDGHISVVLLNTLTDLVISYVQHCDQFIAQAPEVKSTNFALFSRTLRHWQIGFLHDVATRSEIDRPFAEKLLKEVKPPNFWLGLTLARNPNTPQDILETLAGDGFNVPGQPAQFNLAYHVACNQSAPTNILWRLLKDRGEGQARIALASRGTTDPKFLSEWATSDDRTLRMAVGRNTNAPTELLLRLTKDDEAQVRIAASQGLAMSPRTPVHMLQDLVAHARDDVRACVARNPATPGSLLEELLRNDSYQVWTAAFRVLASQNPAPQELLRQRLRSAAPVERRGLSQEKGLPDWVYGEL